MYLSKTSGEKAQPQKYHHYPFYSPRFWHGMRWGDWIRLLARHGFRVHPIRWSLAFTVTLITPFNSVMRLFSLLFFGRAVAETKIEEPPVFIVGHWRSGTTLLHELMVRDKRFAFPTTYQCFAPHHFLTTEWFVASYLNFLLPKHRPMDNMAAGFARPMEDEFALLILGAQTPYLRLAFPNDPPEGLEFVDMQGTSEADLKTWKRSLRQFLSGLTYKFQRRLILKSPPHTGRLEVLAEMFPGARFVNIVRDPLDVFASSRRLWPGLEGVQSLQYPQYENLDEYIFSTGERMYAAYESQRLNLNPEQICEVRYEDLVEDSVGQLERIYQHLDLGDFEPARASLEEYLESQKDYQTNPHHLDEETVAQIWKRWGPYFARHGYRAD